MRISIDLLMTQISPHNFLHSESLRLQTYIREARAAGFSDDAIIQELVTAGWSHVMIEQLISPAELIVPPPPPVIQIRNISKSYDNSGVKTSALNNINLTIARGEFTAIMGSSGSGKSTLMHILGLLDVPTAGTYTLAGREVDSLSSGEKAEVRNQEIGFVFQQFNLLPRTTVLDNVLLPTIYKRVAGSTQRARDIIAKVGLLDRIDHKSNQLSGGQIQRVAIARALMMNPHIILADEPTGNLDSTTSEEIIQLFKEINAEGVTIIIVTHEEEVARHAQRIIRLKDGAIVSDNLTTS